MSIAISFVLVFITVLLIFKYKSKYTWGYILAVLSIGLLMSALILFREKFPIYPSHYLWERQIFGWLNRFKFGFYEIANLVTFGVGIYMLAMCIFLQSLQGKGGTRIPRLILEFVPLLLFLVINSSQFCRRLHGHLYWSQMTAYGEFFRILLKILRIINFSTIIAYLLLPIVAAIKQYRKTRIIYIKRMMLVIGITLFMIDVFFVYMLYLASFQFSLLDLQNLLKFQNVKTPEADWFYTVIPFVVFILFNSSIFFLVHYHALDGVDFLKRVTISKKTKFLFEDIRPMIHSYKNILLSLQFLGEDIAENYGKPEALEDISELVSICRKESYSMANLLNVFNVSVIEVEAVDLVECIKDTAELLSLRKRASVELAGLDQPALILGDAIHLRRMFESMFYNSVEAMEEQNKKIIRISIEREREWYCVSIRDNGAGIERKNLRRIFKPLYSTKRTSKNWGIGLSYVHEVVRAHNGIIFVNSEVGSFTEFQILLPVYEEESRNE